MGFNSGFKGLNTYYVLWNCCAYLCYSFYLIKYTPPLSFSRGSTAILGVARRIVDISRSHTGTFLWMRDRPVAEPLPDNTQLSPETEIRAPDNIRTRSPSKRASSLDLVATDVVKICPLVKIITTEFEAINETGIMMYYLKHTAVTVRRAPPVWTFGTSAVYTRVIFVCCLWLSE